MTKQVSLARVQSYLKNKLATTNVNNNKSNGGCLLILASNDWQSKISTMTMNGFQLLQSAFTKTGVDNEVGITKLTRVCSAIGKANASVLGYTDLKWASEVRLGALFLEAFLQCGYIKIYRDSGYSKYNNQAPYVIEAAEGWATLSPTLGTSVLYATSPTRILEESMDVIKTTNVDTQLRVYKEREAPYKKALYNLQDVAWRINKDINRIIINNEDKYLDPMINLMNEDGEIVEWDVTRDISEIPEGLFDLHGAPFQPQLGNKSAVKDSLSELEKLTKIKKSRKNSNKDLDNRIKRAEDKYNSACLFWNAKLRILSKRSKITEFKFIMEKAKEAQTLEYFHQSQFFDWRSRYYTKESFFAYQGSDIARGQFEFYQGKEMNDEGLFYLAVHTANSLNYSFSKEDLKEADWISQDYVTYLEEEGLEDLSLDKMSLQDRAAYVVSHINDLLKIADEENIDALDNTEKPLVSMACLIEWRNIMDANERGEVWVSHLPIAIDGSNNGVQHTSALTRRKRTGELVGMVPTDIPKDFYIEVAKGLIPTAQHWFDQREIPLKDTRKGIAKRAGMVRQYAAGADKISSNMYADCVKAGYTTKHNINMLDCTMLSHKIVKVIDEINIAGSDVMSYLQKIVSFELGSFGFFDEFDEPMKKNTYYEMRNAARELAKSTDDEDKEKLAILEDSLNKVTKKLIQGNGSKSITWITDSGFPVVYEAYQKKKVKAFVTINGVGRIGLTGQLETEKPDVRKFISGISPNYIHSQDSAHLALVVNEAVANGITSLGMIHDSFSCHASDIPQLLSIAKDTFISMYSDEEKLSKIKDELLTDKHEEFDYDVPELGTLDLESIRKSDYFFC